MKFNHITNRIEQQFILMDLIANAVDNLTKVGLSNITSHRVNARLTSLKENWEKFSLSHEAIGLATTELNPEEQSQLKKYSYFSENLYSMTHECYLEAVEKMSIILDSEQRTMHKTASSQSISQTSSFPTFYQHARLPRIDIPKFNGTPADWLSFKDLFTSLISANSTLSSVEKLQYLKTSLVGSAAHLLKNTTLTADSFQKAWKALISFYENKRLLVNAVLHSLLSLKRMTKESASELEQLYTNITQIYRTLETLQRPIHSWDDFLVFIAVQRLDSESVKAWEHHLGSSKESPSWSQFTEFLFTRLHSLQAFEKSRGGKLVSQSQQNPLKSRFQGKAKENNSNSSSLCSICSAKHYTSNCPQYTSKTVQQRLAIITKNKLCYNCLGQHRVSACRIPKRCHKCGRKHHTTIHQANSQPSCSESGSTKSIESTATAPKTTDTHVLHSISSQKISSCVFLATAQVAVVAQNGEISRVRALIDQGSEISLISERLVQRLKLPRRKSSLPLVGIGAQKSSQTRGITSFKLRPYDGDLEHCISAHILPKFISSIPSVRIEKAEWPHIQGLKLADPSFTIPEPIDIILGADVYGQIIEEGIIKGNGNSPIAQSTKFGWIISGPSGANELSAIKHSYHVSMDRELHDLLYRFWELEEIPSRKNSSISNEEQECEQHFKSTHARDAHGRYIVKLPFKDDVNKLGDSRIKAVRMIKGLTKKFASDQQYAQSYTQFMKKYEELHHMKLVPEGLTKSEPPHVYYLPHHGVVRQQSLTTKLRVVFNGSSRTTTGISLNDILHTGAKLQSDLFDVLIWFRKFCYVFFSDIEKMYRQIKVHPEDWDFQRVLWINKFNNLLPYQLTTVTYGLACAPFRALRTLKQLVEDEGNKFPLATPVLEKGRYVDDLFGGADTIQQAQDIVQELHKLCMAGGFLLQKWTSNHPAILQSIQSEKKINATSLQIEDDITVHALGLCWKPSNDTFHFTLQLSPTKVMTKRAILSTIAKLFDPLGLLSPFIVRAKIIIQELWSIKLDWDDPLPPLISNRWTTFVEELKAMPSLTFPRWLGYKSNDDIEIHGFCDASQQAMSAVIYLKSISAKGEIQTNLVCSKTKVAPLKRLTIPRLELSGAVLLSKLVSHVLRILELDHVPVHLWTDSSITQTWISNHPSRWKDFVHNRVCYIQETVPQAIWHFVPGQENPAGLATRGLTPAQLSDLSVWWTGPHWLRQHPSMWPEEPQTVNSKDNLEERPIQVATITGDRSLKPWNLLNRYSSLNQLLRSTAICQQVINRFRGTQDSSRTRQITPQALEAAKFYWVKAVQQHHFQQEIKTLSQRQSLPLSNPLLRLTPFTDSNGLLRIGGRLQSSLLPSSAKHPLIIPKESALTTLIISDAHLRTMHGGTRLTLSFIRNEFWIIGGRTPVRSHILKCVRCARYRQKRAQQIMGQLPVEKLTPSRPFLNSGVDYAGPFTIKTWKGKNL